MKIKFLYAFFSTAFSITILFSCSSSSTMTEKKEIATTIKQSKVPDKKLALNHFINGGIFEVQGNFESAVKEYENALHYDTSAGIYYSIAKNYLYLNKLPLALKNVKRALNLDSTVTDYYNLLSDIFNYGNQKDSAISALEKATKIDSLDIELNYKLARLYETDKPLKAISIYNRILSQLGSDWSIISRIAELNEKLGNSEGAIKSIDRLLELDPGNIQLKKMLIEYNIRAKHYDRGIQLVDEILELMPSDIEAREMKGNLLIAKNDWTGASKEFDYLLKQPNIKLEDKVNIGANYFDRAVKDSTLLPIAKTIFTQLDKDTTDWQIKMYLGAIALSEKNDSVAIENFKYVTENANWNVQAWIRLGGLYFDNHKYKEAEVVMSEAIISFPDDFYVNLILGLALAQQSKNKESEPYLKKATILNPNDINALSAYGFTLSQLKQNEQAIYYLKKALEIEPNDVQLIGTLAMIYNGMKSYQISDSLYEKALELKPDDPLINNNYSYSFATRSIQLERALKMIKISIAADSLNSSYLDTMGWVYYMLGDYESAKTYIEKAIKVGGKSSVILDHLADTEFKLGNKQKAVELWQNAFDLDPSKTEIKNKIEKGAI
jgi:tetratricopeptide (TPR) repeat protein